MLREIETDRTTDCVEQVSPTGEQITGELEKLQWKRATKDNKFMKNLKNLLLIYAYTISNHNKDIEKCIKKMKRF